MNTPARLAPDRARPLTRTFAAWTLHPNGKATPTPIVAVTLEETEFQALGPHKSTFVVRDHDPVSGKTFARFYTVKQHRPVYDPVARRFVGRLYPEAMCAIEVSAFEPVEPWRWTPGCDPVGLTPSLVEVRP